MQRITRRDLEAVCNRINRAIHHEQRENSNGRWATGKVTNGGYQQLPDVFYIDGAYGGVALFQTCSPDANGESHGVSDVFGMGHMPKRELYNMMQGFLRGMEARERFEKATA